MEIRYENKQIIITPKTSYLGKKEIKEMFENIRKSSKKLIAVDLSFVFECSSDFFEGMNDLADSCEVGVFNIHSDIFALFNMFNLDKKLKLFVCESDCEENQRRLINRNFRVI